MSSWRESLKRIVSKHGGYQHLAGLVDRSGEGLRKKVEGNGEHDVYVRELVTIIEYTGQHAPLHDLAHSFGYVCYRNRFDGVDDNQELMLRFNAAFAKLGEFVGKFNEYLADDGSIDSGEMSTLQAVAFEQIALLNELQARIWQLYGVRP